MISHNLLRLLKFPSIVLLIALFCSSCASTPQHTYFRQGDLSDVHNVGIRVTAEEFEVREARDANFYGDTSATILSLFFSPFLAGPLEAAIRSVEDSSSCDALKKANKIPPIEILFQHHFILLLNKSNIFTNVFPLHNEKDNETALVKLDMQIDAIINLHINELSLKNRYKDASVISLNVLGQMIKSDRNEIIWERNIQMESDDAHTFDYYKQYGLSSLDALVKKVVTHLANDIIYSK